MAPSLIPRCPGERCKHDRKDAEELARLYRARGTGRIPDTTGEPVKARRTALFRTVVTATLPPLCQYWWDIRYFWNY